MDGASASLSLQQMIITVLVRGRLVGQNEELGLMEQVHACYEQVTWGSTGDAAQARLAIVGRGELSGDR